MKILDKMKEKMKVPKNINIIALLAAVVGGFAGISQGFPMGIAYAFTGFGMTFFVFKEFDLFEKRVAVPLGIALFIFGADDYIGGDIILAILSFVVSAGLLLSTVMRHIFQKRTDQEQS